MKKPILLSLLVLTPSLAQAQARTVIAPYVAADRMAAGNPVMVGATVGWELGYVAARWGVAVGANPGSVPGEPGERADRRVGSDLDAMLFVRNPGGPAAAMPYAVGGIGLRAVEVAGAHQVAATWAAGGGVRVPIAGRLAVEGEARHVSQFSGGTDQFAPRPDAGMELRAGVSLRLGGRAPAAVVAPPTILTPRPLPTRVGVDAGSRSAALIATGALSEAERHLGVRYRWGGNSPNSGFDCSGFISYVFRLQGIDLPRVSQDQARAGVAVPLELDAFQPGDLIAFASRGTVDHVAIYAGNGRIIHSSSSGGGVRYDDLTTARGNWFVRHMVAARRVIPEGEGFHFVLPESHTGEDDAR
jgi:cell wall-associated NlpC family hydrolase